MQLLIPIKEKHGDKLSWGDLIVIAADAAIISMGGPVIGFCGGRIDFQNGDQSLPLGPSSIQQKFMPCGPEQCPVGEVCPGTLRYVSICHFLLPCHFNKIPVVSQNQIDIHFLFLSLFLSQDVNYH